MKFYHNKYLNVECFFELSRVTKIELFPEGLSQYYTDSEGNLQSEKTNIPQLHLWQHDVVSVFYFEKEEEASREYKKISKKVKFNRSLLGKLIGLVL